MSATNKKSRVSNTKKTVNVQLEKAEEEIEKPVKTSIAQVDPAIVFNIKNQAQIEEEQILQENERKLEEFRGNLRNRLVFYGGVAASIAILYLIFGYRSGKSLPPPEFVKDLVNGTKNVVGNAL